MKAFLCVILPLTACGQLDSSHTVPYVACTAREVVSGICTTKEIRCPEPLAVAQKIDGFVFCKIKGPEKFQDPVAKVKP